MNNVEKIIIQTILTSVMDYNNSIEMLEPGVKKYFNDHYDDVWCHLYEWHLVDNGNNIEITYTKQYLNGAMEYETDTVPIEAIVEIAVALSLNKRL
jgi:hypothetical protein